MTEQHAHYERLYRAKHQSGEQGWLAPEVDQQILDLARRALDEAGVCGGSLLELGCGAGNLSLALESLGFEVHGIDVSPSAIAWAAERARARGARAVFQVGNVADLGADGPRFNVIVDGLCLHCLVGADRARCLRNVADRLRPGGVFLVMTMCNDPRPAGLRATFDPITRTVGNGQVYLGLAPSIEQELRQEGFAIFWKTVQPGDSSRGAQDLLIAACRRKCETSEAAGADAGPSAGDLTLGGYES